jgi:uncharacterized protein (DUF697 family)
MLDVREKANDTSAPSDAPQSEMDFQTQIAEQMMGLFDLVIDDRRNYFAKNPEKCPNRDSVDSIIASYSNGNAAISGAAGLIPGPFGMLAALPEIVAVIRNQLAMIYDIGVAYGQTRALTKELLAGVLISAVGSGATGLLVMQGGKVLVQRVALRAFQQIIVLFAGKVTQQMLKSMISKWLPFVGAAAMSAWSKYSTHQIGNKAVEIFEKEIEIVDSTDQSEAADTELTQAEPRRESLNTEKIRIQSLINLMKVDGSVMPEEQSYLQIFLDNADLTEGERAELAEGIAADRKFTIDYEILAANPDDAIALLIDLVALANRDGTFHITEKMYVKQVGKLMGFAGSDIDEIMTTAG